MITAKQAKENVVAYKAEQYDREVEKANAYLEEIGADIERASESGLIGLRTKVITNTRSVAASVVLRLLHEAGYKAHYTENNTLYVSWGE